MGKFSDDPVVDEQMNAMEADFIAAQDAYRANLEDETLKAAYKEAQQSLATATATLRQGRSGFGITAEEN